MDFTPKTLCIGFTKEELDLLSFEQLFTDNVIDQTRISLYPHLIKEVIKIVISSNLAQTFEQILTQTLCEMARYTPDNIMQANFVNWDNKMVYDFQSLVSKQIKLDEVTLDRYRCGDQSSFVYAVAYRNGKTI